MAAAFPLGSEVNVGGGGGGVGRGGWRRRRRPRLAAGGGGGGRAGSNRCGPRRAERPLPEAPPWRGARPASASRGLPPAEASPPSLEVRPPRSPLCLRAFPLDTRLGLPSVTGLISGRCHIGLLNWLDSGGGLGTGSGRWPDDAQISLAPG